MIDNNELCHFTISCFSVIRWEVLNHTTHMNDNKSNIVCIKCIETVLCLGHNINSHSSGTIWMHSNLPLSKRLKIIKVEKRQKVWLKEIKTLRDLSVINLLSSCVFLQHLHGKRSLCIWEGEICKQC